MLIDDVLEALQLHSTVFSRMKLAGEWGFAKDSLSGAPFHLILSGSACLMMDGLSEPLALEAGDVVILPRGDEHQLTSRRGVKCLPWRQVVEGMGWSHWHPGMRFKTVDLKFGTGEPTTTLVTGVFAFGDHRRNPLLAALPPMLVMRRNSGTDARAMTAITDLLDAELLSGRPGAEYMAARLADILFIHVVRHQLTSGDELPIGWLRGMADREIGAALALMHRALDKPWSVETLARELGMSRSRFAARFQETVGQAPVEYLTQSRMYLAAAQLAEGKVSLAALAAASGYKSEVSFSKAFKRWAGCSPTDYRRGHLKNTAALPEQSATTI